MITFAVGVAVGVAAVVLYMKYAQHSVSAKLNAVKAEITQAELNAKAEEKALVARLKAVL
jgi:hypothetical protein